MNTLSTQVLSSGGLAVRASNKEDNGIVESLYRTAARQPGWIVLASRCYVSGWLSFFAGLAASRPQTTKRKALCRS